MTLQTLLQTLAFLASSKPADHPHTSIHPNSQKQEATNIFTIFLSFSLSMKRRRDIFISMLHLITNIQLKCIQSKKYSSHIFSYPLFHWHMKGPKFMRGELLVEFKGGQTIWPSQVSPIPQLCWSNTDYNNSAPRVPHLRHLNRCDAQ